MITYKPVHSQADVQLVSKLAFELFPQDYGAYVRPEHIRYFLQQFQSPEAIARQIREDHVYFLIYTQGELLGYVGLKKEASVLKLSKIYLDSHKRGKGWGNKILGWLTNYAHTNDCSHIQLDVLVQNEKAIRFYEREGFERVEVFEQQFKTGYSETNLKMQKRLK